MIEYDYKIRRDEENEIREFSPNKIDSTLPNLVRIKGENSVGKSTLLNILAGAFFGLKNDNLPNSLDRSIRNLFRSDYQDLTFNIRIEDETNDLSITAEKKNLDSKDIKREISINGETSPLTQSEFENRFKLVYDIPENPLNRIENTVDEVQRQQTYTYTRLQEFHNFLSRKIREINEAKDPELIDSKQETLEDRRERKNKLQEAVTQLEEELEIVESYTYKVMLEQKEQKKASLEDQIKVLENEVKESDEIPQKINQLNNRLETLDILYDDILADLRNLFSESSDFVEKFESLDLNPASENNYHFDEDIDEVINTVREKVREDQERMAEEDSLQEAELVDDLVSVLSEYEKYDIEIPGVRKRIDEFLEILQEEETSHKDLKNRYTKLETLIESLDKLDFEITDIESEFLSQLRGHETEDETDLSKADKKAELKRKERRLEKIKTEYDKYKQKYQKIGSPSIGDIKDKAPKSKFQDLGNKSEEELKSKIQDKKKEIESKENKLNKLEVKIENLEDLLEDLKQRDEHPLKDREDDIEKLKERVESLTRDFKDYNKLLNELRGSNRDNLNEDEDYFQLLFDFMGKRLGEIRHIDDEYDVEEINMIREYILTSEGKKVRFDDLGTGQGQSAYLESVLNTSGDRKIIALLDEIAMLDKESRKRVFDRIKELKEEGKLVAAIAAEYRDEGVEIISM